MSGGSFDYKCFAISQFAEELKNKIDENNRKDEYGYSPDFSIKTISILEKCQIVIEKTGKIAKEIEWLYSEDIGEDTFLKRINLNSSSR